MEAFQIKNLTFTYPNRRAPALENINFSINCGEFITLCGTTGSGKSTLLRQLKPALTPYGKRSGTIMFMGSPLCETSLRTQASDIGFVLQNPENQIVSDMVWHELAFGLESMGLDAQTIRLRVAETAGFFGIGEWFHKAVSELSGGQKQILNLAGIMAMQPSVLILDEPTAQLDPIAATNFQQTVSKINRDLGTTVIISEHRLEELLPMSDRLIVMDGGRIIESGEPRGVCESLKKRGHDMFKAMPTPVRIFAAVPGNAPCPLTVREGRDRLKTIIDKPETEKPLKKYEKPEIPPVLELRDIWFKYEKNSPDIIKGMSVSVYKSDFLAIMGGNGAGKTTVLSILSGLLKPYRGKAFLNGRELGKYSDSELYFKNLGVMPQDTRTLFVKDTVRQDLNDVLALNEKSDNEGIAQVAELARITDLLDIHPYDLSGGEQQRAALAKILLTEPEILLLDEPTKGLDGNFKEKFGNILKRLQDSGVSIVMVSHDIEFCARYADRCVMLFDGINAAENSARGFFSGNSLYTTAANRMARGIIPGAVTPEDVVNACLKAGSKL